MGKYSDSILGGEQSQERAYQPAGGYGASRYADMVLGPDPKPKKPQYEISDPQEKAGFGTLVKAAMVDDPATRLRIFAKDRFPDMDEKEALSRYGMLDGEVVYLGDDEKVYRESPKGVLEGGREVMAGLVGHSPSLVLGTAGAIGGAAAGGVPGSIGGALLGGAGGEGYRKATAALAFDEPQDVAGNLKSMGVEALWAGAGDVGGQLLSKFLSRRVARDITRMDPAESERLGRIAQREGIPITPAEQTGLKSLVGQQRRLQYMPESQDILDDFIKNTRNPKIRDSLYRFFDTLSPEASPLVADQAGKRAAGKAISAMEDEAQQAARPLYKAAEPQQLADSADLGYLMNDPVIARAAQRVSRNPQFQRELAGTSDQTVQFWDLVKKNLDDQHTVLQRAGKGNEARSVDAARKDLLKMLDDVSPEYKQARAAFASKIKPAEEAKEGLAGLVANVNNENGVTAAKILFSPQNSSPEAVFKAKQVFAKAGTEGKEGWNKLVRAHLQTEFERIAASSVDEAVNIGGIYRKGVFGSTQQQQMLKSALTPDQFRSFNDLMAVLQATGRAFGKNSWTPFEQQARKDIAREAGGAGGQVVETVMAPLRVPGRIADWYQDLRIGKYSEKLAEIITSPEGMKKLRELRQLSPNDQKLITGFATLTGLSIGLDAPEGPERAIPTEDQPRRQ